MAKVSGGRRIREWVRRAEAAARKPQTVEVGFFPESRYPDGDREHVAAVAFMHEYGLGDLPERAFLRPAAISAQRPVRAAIRQGIRGRSIDSPFTLPASLARAAGNIVADQIRSNIDALREPPNEPETLARKGSKKPLKDTLKLRQSIEVRLAGGAADGTG